MACQDRAMCTVPGCNSDRSAPRHSFPTKLNPYGDMWLRAIKNPILYTTPYSDIKRRQYFVCRKHFVPRNYFSIIRQGKEFKRLRKDAVPSLFLPSVSEVDDNPAAVIPQESQSIDLPKEASKVQNIPLRSLMSSDKFFGTLSEVNVSNEFVTMDANTVSLQAVKIEMDSEQSDRSSPKTESVMSTSSSDEDRNVSKRNSTSSATKRRSDEKSSQRSSPITPPHSPENAEANEGEPKKIIDLAKCPREYLEIIMAQSRTIKQLRLQLKRKDGEINNLKMKVIASKVLQHPISASISAQRPQMKILKASTLFSNDFNDK